jgi:hypothetical protein
MSVKQSTPNGFDVRVIPRVRVRNPFTGAFSKSFEKKLDDRISLRLLPNTSMIPNLPGQ